MIENRTGMLTLRNGWLMLLVYHLMYHCNLYFSIIVIVLKIWCLASVCFECDASALPLFNFFFTKIFILKLLKIGLSEIKKKFDPYNQRHPKIHLKFLFLFLFLFLFKNSLRPFRAQF